MSNGLSLIDMETKKRKKYLDFLYKKFIYDVLFLIAQINFICFILSYKLFKNNYSYNTF